MATEEFREALKEPYQHLQRAERLLENETNENLPEGQLRAQVSRKKTPFSAFLYKGLVIDNDLKNMKADPQRIAML